MEEIEKKYDQCYISDNYNYLCHRKISVLSIYRSVDSNDGSPIVDFIKNIFELSSEPYSIEFLLRIDNDQNDLYNFLSNNEIINFYNVKIYSGKRHGFTKLYEYNNEMIAMSVGDIIFLAADGNRMMDKGWDEFLYPYRDKFAIIRGTAYQKNGDGELKLYPYSNPIPIITRKIYDILGRWTPTVYSDFYLDFVSGISGIKCYIEMRYFIFDNVISNTEEHISETNLCKEHLHSYEIQQELKSDVLKIINYCKDNNIPRKILPDILFYMGLYNSDPCFPCIEIHGGEDINKKYLVEFIDKDNNFSIYSTTISSYCYAICTPTKPFHINLLARVSSEGYGVFFEKEIEING